MAANKQSFGSGSSGRNLPASFSNLRPSVMTHLALMAEQGLGIDTLGIPGAVLSQIGIGTPGLTIVMDHVADKPTNFDVDDPWKADMLAASTYTGRNIKVSGVHKLNSQVLAGLPAGLTKFQPGADPSPYAPTLEFLWRTFGEDRLLSGANWPVSDAGGIFVDSIDLEIGLLESFLAEQYVGGQDKVMYQNALRLYSPQVTSHGVAAVDWMLVGQSDSDQSKDIHHAVSPFNLHLADI